MNHLWWGKAFTIPGPLSSYGVGGPSWGSLFTKPGSYKPGMPVDSSLARLMGTPWVYLPFQPDISFLAIALKPIAKKAIRQCQSLQTLPFCRPIARCNFHFLLQRSKHCSRSHTFTQHNLTRPNTSRLWHWSHTSISMFKFRLYWSPYHTASTYLPTSLNSNWVCLIPSQPRPPRVAALPIANTTVRLCEILKW